MGGWAWRWGRGDVGEGGWASEDGAGGFLGYAHGMTSNELREIPDRYARECARREAVRLDDQVRMWLRCGYSLDELVILHHRQPTERESEVVPRSFERAD